MSTVIPEEKEKLHNEQLLGNRAQIAYDQFIHQFIEDKRMSLFMAFSNLALSDTENLMEVKRMLFAIDALDTEILTVIDTGKMASMSLNEEEVKH